jgi:hypothetical protein
LPQQKKNSPNPLKQHPYIFNAGVVVHAVKCPAAGNLVHAYDHVRTAGPNGNLPKKSPKLRQIHPKSRKFESCHLTRMQPVWIFPEPATPAGSFLLQNRRFWNLRRYPVKCSQNIFN